MFGEWTRVRLVTLAHSAGTISCVVPAATISPLIPTFIFRILQQKTCDKNASAKSGGGNKYIEGCQKCSQLALGQISCGHGGVRGVRPFFVSDNNLHHGFLHVASHFVGFFILRVELCLQELTIGGRWKMMDDNCALPFNFSAFGGGYFFQLISVNCQPIKAPIQNTMDGPRIIAAIKIYKACNRLAVHFI